VTNDPAWPWSLAPFGLPGLAVVALVLTGLTVWTYVGVPGAGFRRVLVVLGLRLAALVLACLMLLRPSVALRDSQHPPSTLLIVVDASGSMSIVDEFGPRSRWDYVRQLLRDAGPDLQKLRDEQHVEVAVYRFAEDVADYDPDGHADGKRTDFGQMLHALYERHSRDRNLRGILILSDGADNGTRFPAVTEAGHWRSLPCPVDTFGLGQPTTPSNQRDIAFAGRPGMPAIVVEPSPVAIKGKLTVKGTLDAPGFENETVMVRLLIDDKEVHHQEETLRKTTGNEVKLVTDAPARAGEIKVTLKVDPKENEVTTVNNEISTFVTVTKEGLSVLVVDRPRGFEPQFICDALAADPRIRVYPAWRWSERAAAEEEDLFQFDKHPYDVIILGDVTPERLAAGNPKALGQIRDLVRDKGVGLLMMGGYDTFGNQRDLKGIGWKDTPLADVLPVKMDATGQIDGLFQLAPTREGLVHYIRVAEKDKANEALWQKLPKLNGMTKLGTPKPLAAVLAVRADDKEPVLVGQPVGKGRTLAFAADTTWRWQRLGQPKSNEGLQAHAHFWRQLVLWLAQQDKIEGNAYVKPDTRRLATGSKLGFKVGLRGQGGKEMEDAQFQALVFGPHKAEFPVPIARDQGDQRGVFWKTEAPGEYRLRLKAWPKGADPKKARPETAEARFIVYEDDAEMVRRAADHVFLERLATAGGGRFHKGDEFARFLKDLGTTPLPQGRQNADLWPDWRRNSLSGFLVAIFALFVAVLCLEWFLRRRWGLV
jgi:uncharacterized membrane protein